MESGQTRTSVSYKADGGKSPPFNQLLWPSFFAEPSSDRLEEITRSMRLLLPMTEPEPNRAFRFTTKEAFSSWLHEFDPLYYSKSVEERFDEFLSASAYTLVSEPSVLLNALNEDSIFCPKFVNYSNPSRVTLLHAAAKEIAFNIAWEKHVGDREFGRRLRGKILKSS